MFRLTTLGAIDLRDRLGKPQREALSQPKRLALLVYLAIEARRGPVERDQLLEMFWPQSDPERARNALSQALHHLRHALGPHVIESHGVRALAVDASQLWCDAVVFTEAIERGETELALDLYRGELCPSLEVSGAPAFDAWLAECRRRLQAQARAAARAVAERLLAAGDTAGAARAARRVLAMPSDDDADGRAMEALLAGGGTGETAPVGNAPLAPRGRAVAAAAGVLVAVAGLVFAATWSSRNAVHRMDRDLIAVAPFRITASDSGLAFLGEGMVDLLARRLNGAGRLRTADPRTVFAIWRADAGADAGGPGAVLARSLGARWLVMGAVLGGPRRMTFAVTLTDRATGASRDAEAAGPLDSLGAMVDDLALQLLPVISGEPQPRTAALTRTPMPALRAYLDGRSAFRAGHFDDAVLRLREAVALDSTFAVAALELAYAAGFGSEGSGRYLAGAMALRDRLAPGDRAMLSALAGPRYPARSPVVEALDAWERAVQLAPQSPEAWYDMGDLLFHAGDALGRDSGFARAEAAMRRAAELDSGEARSLVHLTQIALRRGNLVEARRMAALVFRRDSTTEQAQFLRWRLAVAAGDTVGAGRIEDALDTLPTGTVRRLVDWSQSDGVRPGLARRAVDVFSRRAATAGDADLAMRQQMVVLANAGRFSAWMAAAHRVVPGAPVAQFAIQTYAWLDGPPSGAAEAASRSTPDLRAIYEMRECERRVPGACEALRSAVAALPNGWRSLNPVSRILTAAVLGLPGTGALIDGMESLRDSAMDFGEFAFYSYAEGRAWAALDEPARALAALRRRPYATMEANNFLAPSLRLEGRLAAQLGDTAGAIRAYRHYLILRADPDPAVKPSVDSVRSELDRLARRP